MERDVSCSKLHLSGTICATVVLESAEEIEAWVIYVSLKCVELGQMQGGERNALSTTMRHWAAVWEDVTLLLTSHPPPYAHPGCACSGVWLNCANGCWCNPGIEI